MAVDFVQIGNNATGGGGGVSFTTNVETLAADKQIMAGDPTIQRLDPGGSNRIVALTDPPTEGDYFIIYHSGTADELDLRETLGGGTEVTLYAPGTPGHPAKAICSRTSAGWEIDVFEVKS